MRLVHPAFEPAAPTVAFTYDGREVTGYEGETIAAALSAAGILELRHATGGTRRGLWCGMGACFECLVTIDGQGSQRACLAKLRAGAVVTSTAPAAPLTALAPEPAVATIEHRPDLLVVGAGPAGLAAALEAAHHLTPQPGDGRIVVLDERPAPGGQYFKQLASTHRFAGGRFADRQFRDGAALIREVRAAGVEILSDASVWGAFAADEIAALVEGRSTLFRPKQLILAAGAYERPVPMPGWTLPGVMTTGALQTLARAYRVAPGRRVVVAGNGPLNLQTAVELLDGGVAIAAVIERAAAPDARQLRRLATMVLAAPDLALDGARLLLRLRRAGVPVLWACEVAAAEGDGRLARVTVRGADGEARTIEADVLALGHGFVPATELGRMLGLEHRFVDRHVGYMAPSVDAVGRSSQPSIFVIGDGAEMGGARVARARGTLAGHAAASALLGRDVSHDRVTRARRDLARAERFQKALWSLYAVPAFDAAALADDVIVCRCETLTAGRIRTEIRGGATAMGAIKKLSRAGMGRCQGRNCAATIARILHAETKAPLDEFAFFAPQAPARPVPLGALAFEKSEWGGHKAVTPPPPLASRAARTRSDTIHQADVLVIGGGVLGMCTAYYLARDGIDVLVAERDEINLQASGANAGSLHVQLLSWDFGAKAEAGGGPAAQTLALGPESVRLWQAIERDTGIDCEFRVTGGLMVAENEAGLAFLRAKIALENRFGVEATMIDGAELRRLSPHLGPHFVGAELCPMEGKINPLTATYAAARGAAAAGARVLPGA
ncbi:MAG: FAD-dependent oxidoreductase, partial [Alphaproteobacteria bacterium]|nr:FAD-dependent oxidoreductase [Alphaproteobacteria bacterium]